jgi:DNA-binding CsgD family transcriptional regulator
MMKRMAKSLDVFARSASAIADAALAATTCDGFRREALATVRSLIEFDFGIAWGIPESPDDATLVGIPVEVWQQYFAAHERFGRDLAPLVGAAQQRGVVNDREVFDPRARDRLGFYVEIIKPLGSRNFLTAIMGAPGRGLTAIQLGRAGRHGSLFNDSHERILDQLLPVLSLGEALHKRNIVSLPSPGERDVADCATLGSTDRESGLACGALTRKEREVLELFEHGASYPDVARILQISVNTVRAHVRHIYEKLHVTSKVEAVMRLRHGRSTP